MGGGGSTVSIIIVKALFAGSSTIVSRRAIIAELAEAILTVEQGDNCC